MRSELRLGLAIASVGLLGALVWAAGVRRLVDAVARTDPALYLLAMAVFASTYGLIALRWRTLQRAVDADLTLQESFEITAVSYGLNKLLPANTGDVVRSKIAERYVPVESHAVVLSLVAAERAADVAVLGLAVVALPWTVGGLEGFRRFAGLGLAVLLLVGAVGLGIVLARPGALAGRVPHWLEGPIDRVLGVAEAVSAGTAAAVALLSVCRWLVVAVSFQLLGLSIGLDLPLAAAALVVAAMSLAAVLPVAPGGLGTVDATGTGLLVLVGVGYAPALTLVLLQRSFGIGLMAVVGMAVYGYRVVVPPHVD